MDDKLLDEILDGGSVPPSDEKKKSQTIGLALEEFDSQKSRKSFQGFKVFSSLMGKLIEGGNPMNKKIIYSGLATACVATLVLSTQRKINLSELDKDLHEAAAPEEIRQEQFAGQADERLAAHLKKTERVKTDIATLMVAPSKSRELKAPYSPSRKRLEPMGSKEKLSAAGQFLVVDQEYVDQKGYVDVGRDKFQDFEENRFYLVSKNPVSTFSSDVDTSSYSFVRSQLNSGVLPAKDAVRTEELINYFNYDYDLPDSKSEPFKPSVSVYDSPWSKGKKLIHIGIKGYDIKPDKKPKSNLVFLVDVSGSMNNANKLPLLKKSLAMLVDTLGDDDTISLVTYAGSAGTALEPTKVKDKSKILAALEGLGAGGSTAGAEGIRQAYQLAEANFDKNAVNRVLLATDGDFNVGITNYQELQDFVERKRNSGVYLSVLGFGQGNYNDQLMQVLAQNGNGVAAYIDTLSEARKVLVDEATSTLFPIAKDVKFQIEFNPKRVAEYRLIGYETRKLNREDFNNDKVDAGDIGSGHTVTAIYEITEVGQGSSVDSLRYGDDKKELADKDGEFAFLKIRYKLPKESKSKLIEYPITNADKSETVSDDVKFGTAVAAFAQILKGGKYTGDYSYSDVIDLAQSSKGADEYGYRTEFVQLVRMAKTAGAIKATR